MQATAQIHSKAKTQQQFHVKCTETVQGPNHRTVGTVYHVRVLSHIVVRLTVKGLNNVTIKEKLKTPFVTHLLGK